MNIQVLIATMNNNDIDGLIESMNIQTDCIVVNQCNCKEESIISKKIKNKNVKIINSLERGLSRSRNTALKNLPPDTDIIIFTDDDIYFYDGYEKEISNAYKNNECDGIVFNVRRVNGRLNKKMSRNINQINLFRACSVSLTFRANSIKNIKFDENFGSGSGKFILGEENIFVSDCLKANKKIIKNDYVMCRIEDRRKSTWFTGFNNKYLISKGASFKRMHKYLYFLYNIDFAIRKYKLYKENFSFIKALNYLFNGSNDYLNKSREG